MRSIANVFSAFANLAASINALAGVFDAAAGRLRQQLALDDALPGVLEHQPAGGDNAALDDNGTAKSKKGKSSAV